MKHSDSVKTILTSFLGWMINRIPAAAIVIGFFLMYGAAGSMDFNALTGTSDSPWNVILLILGLIMMGAGLYGSRKNF